MGFERVRQQVPPARIPLWLLRHASGNTIECSMQVHPRGLEFQATLNTRVLHRQLFESMDELLLTAGRGKGRLESRGWTVVATKAN
jgi:hypothetical protein